MEVKVWGPGGEELVFLIATIEYSPEWHHQVSQSYQGRVNISKEANLGGRMVSWSTDNTHIRAQEIIFDSGSGQRFETLSLELPFYSIQSAI